MSALVKVARESLKANLVQKLIFRSSILYYHCQNVELFDRNWFTIFDIVLTPFWKMFLLLKQKFDAKLLVERLLSFSVPKITVVRHV